MVRHPETRPVSLLELVRAFDEAEAGARRAVKLQELRERLREEQRAPPEVLVHGDIPELDLVDAWEAALRHPMGEPFPLLDLWNPLSGRDRLVAIFLATLFLARERSIELRQEVLGESPVFGRPDRGIAAPGTDGGMTVPSKLDDLVLRIEAVLFAAGKPLSVKELTAALDLEHHLAAAMIYQRFGKWWGRFSLFDLLLVNS